MIQIHKEQLAQRQAAQNENKKLSYFPVLKETTGIEYRTGKAAREQVNLHDQNNQNKKASSYIVYEWMKH